MVRHPAAFPNHRLPKSSIESCGCAGPSVNIPAFPGYSQRLAGLPILDEFRLRLRLLLAPAHEARRVVLKFRLGQAVDRSGACRRCPPPNSQRIKELVKQGFYDGIVFHRVIDGFMAQTGCPQGTGTGGSGKKLKAEFNKEPHVRGTVSMARAASRIPATASFSSASTMPASSTTSTPPGAM